MGKAGLGAKAGVVAGLVYGILDGIFAYVVLVIFKTDVMKVMSTLAAKETSLGIKVTGAQLYSTDLTLAPVEGIVGGLIIGIILGIIFAYTHNKIPGKNMIIKGEIFGLILWIIFDVLIGAVDISTYGLTYYIASIAFDIIPLVVFGFILGTLYNKWEVKDTPVTDEEFNKMNSGNL
ncbi:MULTISPECIES: DUF6789 family protein [Ferroplasma]|jgi:hypothetical protein|uniref:Uncharacterized protein n=2 Tax=Ferroplasma TaxID=74968 RepID=S0AS86_FERAC|nr:MULTISPECIES: DUF6789 family protein [Ferroplasma]MCL4349406.1 hypothetical protein [Candidatus Thermoplasmatota archaeon]AGO60975.1 hypothetical protein FACI_IFERC00001G0995 [Ferroplasma acidarmanus Fer1]ARD83953.1 hypothetical protein FAD_0018 [Ferroplasma acidiphilum]NOL60323.1 hypothetical protein [Ferroplasma acidiphilum]WMT52855.1 MAG: hypothetical protein RE473_07540 [Ferroplasma acidiphilum]